MFTEKIGENAGAIWNVLANGEKDVKEIKKAAKLKNEKEVNLALGWLAREGKINFREEGKDLFVSLV